MSIAEHPAGVRTAPLTFEALKSVSLDGVVSGAALMNRVDRKYLVSTTVATKLLDELASSHAVLQIADRYSTTYRSTYFDTAGLAATRAHVQRRRIRWKIRQRWYVEDGLCRIEVKTKNGRGATIKSVGPSSVENYGRLGSDEATFVSSVLGRTHPGFKLDDLVPTAEVIYSRATLADLAAGTRVTLDWGLIASLAAGEAWLDHEFVLVETKGTAVPAVADHALRVLGARPLSFSKYAATTSLLHPDIPDNDFRRHSGIALHIRPTEGLS